MLTVRGTRPSYVYGGVVAEIDMALAPPPAGSVSSRIGKIFGSSSQPALGQCGTKEPSPTIKKKKREDMAQQWRD
ncbi:hypothetical protein EVAR_40559_1 [Eumeta japonica]|uniref:Uncharacterized protein n=1 Tax=Eumeta variegata TaxID=151549 RepID=A0A4C1VXY9_EUMVA|nr:hypothetical protein EVAR_40559_1 [Eumeta japonica]